MKNSQQNKSANVKKNIKEKKKTITNNLDPRKFKSKTEKTQENVSNWLKNVSLQPNEFENEIGVFMAAEIHENNMRENEENEDNENEENDDDDNNNNKNNNAVRSKCFDYFKKLKNENFQNHQARIKKFIIIFSFFFLLLNF